MDPILDHIKQAEVCAVLTAGGTRKMAARLVGCHPRTISRTAARDPRFAERLTRTELSPEIKFLKNIADAAADKKYWRAAAWALERIHPNRYARRKPDTVTIDHITEITAYVVDAAMKATPHSRAPDQLRQELTKIAKNYFARPSDQQQSTDEDTIEAEFTEEELLDRPSAQEPPIEKPSSQPQTSEQPSSETPIRGN